MTDSLSIKFHQTMCMNNCDRTRKNAIVALIATDIYILFIGECHLWPSAVFPMVEISIENEWKCHLNERQIEKQKLYRTPLFSTHSKCGTYRNIMLPLARGTAETILSYSEQQRWFIKKNTIKEFYNFQQSNLHNFCWCVASRKSWDLVLVSEWVILFLDIVKYEMLFSLIWYSSVAIHAKPEVATRNVKKAMENWGTKPNS